MNYILLIVGMALVTYIPRAVPAFISDKMTFGGRFECFINLIPFTAMTALIFPGILSVDTEMWYIGAVGGVVAILLSLVKKIPSYVVVCGSVVAVIIMYLIF